MIYNKHSSIIIYLVGKPGIGKYTIAKILANHGFKICDNQLINNPIFELLNYDGLSPILPSAWHAIARIRKVIFDFIALDTDYNYILTNHLEKDASDSKLFQQVKLLAFKRQSIFIPIHLIISNKFEHLRRLTQPIRRSRWKSTNPIDAECDDNLKIEDNNLLTLKIDNLTAEQSAAKIVTHVQMIVNI